MALKGMCSQRALTSLAPPSTRLRLSLHRTKGEISPLFIISLLQPAPYLLPHGPTYLFIVVRNVSSLSSTVVHGLLLFFVPLLGECLLSSDHKALDVALGQRMLAYEDGEVF